MIYGSVCSGIEAATQAWHPLGWQPAWFSEIEKFPSAVLAHRYPDVPNRGDMTKFKEWPDGFIDLLVGGTPCQSFSIAGLRRGLDDPRGNLMLTYLAILGRYRPRWCVWENVPGVLSSNGGRDFGAFLTGLAKLGYGFAYRVLDAQYVRTCGFEFAVPQRRRRVFVVGYLGDWRRAAAVLFDGESLSGNPPPRREAGQGVAPTLSARTRGGGGLGTDFDVNGGLIPSVANPLTARMHKGVNTTMDEGQTMVAHALRGEGFDASEDGTGRGTPVVPVAYRTAGDGAVFEEGDKAAPLTTGTDPSAHLVAFSAKDYGADALEDCSPTLRAGGHDGSHANAGVMPAVAFAHNQRGELRTSEVSPQLTTGGGKPGEGYPAVLQNMETRNADAYEADASSVLSELRKAVGEEAFQQWGLGVLASFQSQEVLRSWMHGASLRWSKDIEKSKLVDITPPSEGSCGARRLLHQVWEEGPDGRTPQGRGLAKQLAGQSGEALSVLPPRCSQEDRDVQLVQRAREGARLLRKALSEMEEVGRPAGGESEPAHTAWKVRRLTPTEAHRLQGFPDDWCRIPWRNKPADQCPDGPQYKALGNSMAVNVMQWIGERIQWVEDEFPC